MRKILGSLAILGLASIANAGLAIGDLQFNPDCAASGQIGDGGPYYVSGTPAWLNDANLIDSLTSPISGVPGFAQFAGFVDSFAYEITPPSDAGDGGTVGFVYRIRLAGTGADRLVRAALNPEIWASIDVTEAGADASGISTAALGALNWTDGDPYFIGRDDEVGNPYWQFRLGNHGTVVNRNQNSALIFFATNAQPNQITNLSQITLQDGGAVGGAQVISVPEPAAFALLGSGFLWLLVGRRR